MLMTVTDIGKGYNVIDRRKVQCKLQGLNLDGHILLFANLYAYIFTIQIRVKKISHIQRKALEENKEKHKTLEENVMDSLLGFSRLFKLLVELQKPIVGHNILLDLMIMYNQFYEQLPSKLN